MFIAFHVYRSARYLQKTNQAKSHRIIPLLFCSVLSRSKEANFTQEELSLGELFYNNGIVIAQMNEFKISA